MDTVNGEFDKRWVEHKLGGCQTAHKEGERQQWERINALEKTAAVNAAILKVLLSLMIPTTVSVVGLVFQAFVG